MGLKFQIDTLEGLEDSVKEMYKEVDGKFQLAIDGLPDVGGLKKKVDELLNEKKTAAQKAKEAEAAAEAAKLEAAKKSGDIEAINKSWEQKLINETGTLKGDVDKYKKMIYENTVGAEAAKLAAKIALPGSADVLIPHIKSRLKADIDGDSPKLMVLDLQGNNSAFSLDDLEKEFRADTRFAPIVRGTDGGGADYRPGDGKGGSKQISRKEFEALPGDKRMELIKSGVVPTD